MSQLKSEPNASEDPAWLDYRARFADVYDTSNYAGGLQGFTMRAGHKMAEAHFDARAHHARVLEVGSGTGAHFPFVRHGFDEYVMSDLDARALDVAKTQLSSLPNAARVTYQVHGAHALPYDNGSFDRLIATHVLEHLYQPHDVLKEWRRVVRSGGVLSVLLPTDPGFAWRLGRMLGPRRHSQRLGVDYDYVMAREHVNPLNNLIAFLHHYFPERREQWWPTRVPSMDMNLFYVCHATVP